MPAKHRFLLILCLLGVCSTSSAQGKFAELLRSTGNTRINVSIDPFHFMQHGNYFALDIALNERSSFYYGRSSILAYDPHFLDINFFRFDDFFPRNVDFILQGVGRQQSELGLKFTMSKQAAALNGLYYGPIFRFARMTNVLWENAGPVQTFSHVTEHSRYRQFGMMVGWQKEFAKVLYVDANLQLLANSFTNDIKIVSTNTGASINSNGPIVAAADLKFGFRMADPERSGREYEADDSVFGMLVMTDVLSLVNGKLGGEIYLPIGKRKALGTKFYLRSANYLSRGEVPSSLGYVTGFEAGLNWRNYFYGFGRYEGPYLEVGYTHRKAHAEYHPRNSKITHIHEAHAFNANLGYTWDLSHVPVDVYVQQEVNISEHKFRKRTPGNDFLPGMRTRLGLRLGFEL